MNRTLLTLLYVVLITLCTVNRADSLISLSLRPYPIIPQAQQPDNEQSTTQPTPPPASFIIDYSKTQGIAATYSGIIALADAYGQIIFPRKHTADSVTLVITQKIKPIIMFGTTLAHWIIEDPEATQLFTITKTTDPATNILFWDAQPTTLSTDKIIPAEAVILIANPNNVYIPIGITITKKSNHLLLPPVYIKNEFDALTNTLIIFNLRQFFGSLKTETKDENNTRSRIISID